MQLFLLLSVMMLVAGLIWAVAAFKMAHYYLTLSHHQDLTREQQIVKGALVHVKTQTEALFLLLSDQLDKSLKQVDTQNNIQINSKEVNFSQKKNKLINITIIGHIVLYIG